MGRAILAVVAAAIACAAGGCGTVGNLSGDRTVYGGVSRDIKEGAQRWADWNTPSGRCILPACDFLSAAYLFSIDAPLSAVGDTLTLPWTVGTGLPDNDRGATGVRSDPMLKL